MPTERKRALVAQIQERLSRSNLVILTDYRGLDVTAITALRRGVEKASGGYHVVKNTLLLLALQEVGIEGLASFLEGPTAVAFAYGDSVAMAKAVVDYAKESPFLKIKAAWMEGELITLEDVQALAALPTRPVLLGQLMGTLQSPTAGLVNSLATMLRQLIYALKVRSEEAEAAA